MVADAIRALTVEHPMTALAKTETPAAPPYRYRNFSQHAVWREWCREEAAAHRRMAASSLALVKEFGAARCRENITEATLARGRALEAIARARTVPKVPLP